MMTNVDDSECQWWTTGAFDANDYDYCVRYGSFFICPYIYIKFCFLFRFFLSDLEFLVKNESGCPTSCVVFVTAVVGGDHQHLKKISHRRNKRPTYIIFFLEWYMSKYSSGLSGWWEGIQMCNDIKKEVHSLRSISWVISPRALGEQT